MYAECPHCHAIFRVTQELLEKADGKVRCGQCKKVFAAVTEPPSEKESLQSHWEDHSEESTAPSIPSSQPSFTDPGKPSQDTAHAKLKIPSVFPADLSEFLPVAYRNPRYKLRLRLPKISPTVIAACLLFLFFGQYSVTHRQELAAYPVLRPPLKLLCAITGCEILPQRNLEKIKLLSHSVLTHPNRKNALLIQASMSNQAKFEQDYPIIQIRLGNFKGHTISLRRFGANEYLDDKQPHPEKMPIDKTISIELEVIDPGEKALAFEFEFL